MGLLIEYFSYIPIFPSIYDISQKRAIKAMIPIVVLIIALIKLRAIR